MDAVERGNLAIDAAKLANFLTNNQLVQANGVVVKIQAKVKDLFDKAEPTKKPEEHPYWQMYIACIRVENYILSGNKEAALQDARALGAKI